MAHLIYKKPLLDEKARNTYLGACKELDNRRKVGILTAEDYKAAKKTLLATTERLQEAQIQQDGDRDLKRSTTATTSSSGSENSVRTKKTTSKKGTIFDRNDIGRLVFKPNARTEQEREALKRERRQREQLLAKLQLLEMETRGAEEDVEYAASSASSRVSDRRQSEGTVLSKGSSRSKDSTQSTAKRMNFRFFRWGSSSRQEDSERRSDKDRNGSVSSASIPITPTESTHEVQSSAHLSHLRPLTGKSSHQNLRASNWVQPEMFPRPPTIRAKGTPSFRTRSGSLDSAAASSIVTFSTALRSIRAESRDLTVPDPPRRTFADRFLVPKEEPKDERFMRSLLEQSSLGSGSSIYTNRGCSASIRRRSFSSTVSRDKPGTDHRVFNDFDFDVNYSSVPRRDAPFQFLSTNAPPQPNYSLQVPSPSASYISEPKSAAQKALEESDMRARVLARITLDFFYYYYDEFSSVTHLFEYAKHTLARKPSLASSLRRRQSDFQERAEKERDLIAKESEGIIDEEEVERVRVEIEERTWYLCAQKWLGFGRMLFSPAHHLLSVDGRMGVEDMPDLRVLDLDPYVDAGWAWQCCCEYPNAQIFSVTTSVSVHRHWLSHPHRPPNHTLILAPSASKLLDPFEVASFDVISTRSLASKYVLEDKTTHYWSSLLYSCNRLLKPTGFLEILIIEPTLDHAGREAKSWIQTNLLSQELHPTPSTALLPLIQQCGFTNLHKCRVWMPASDQGDELSCVTARLGRGMFEAGFGQSNGLWAALKKDADESVTGTGSGAGPGFRWVKCFAGKA